VRIGIIGLGFGVKVHHPAFSALPGVQVVALCGTSAARLIEVQQRFPDTRLHDDWRRLIDDPGIDAASVAVPPDAQQQIVCALLRAGKHVLCEKPLGLTTAHALAMCQAATASARVHAVDFQFRFNPGIQRLKELIGSGAMGKIERLEVSWLSGGRADPALPFSWQHDRARGGGILNSYATHVFDYLEWLTGARVLEMLATTAILIPKRKNHAGQAMPVTAEDSCDCSLSLNTGAQVSVRISNCQADGDGHRIEVVGKGGRVRFFQSASLASPECVVEHASAKADWRREPVHGAEGTANWDNHHHGFARVAAEFIRKINGGDTPTLAGFEAGLRARQLVDAALQSAAEGRPVNVRK
jgi:predicted dehydrogenase